MGYNNDTYWNWQTWETTDPAVRTDKDNPRFLTDTGTRPSYQPVLKRGFIRSAVPEKYTRRRCFFQFNPSLLVRSTAPSGDALPWLQDPGQLSIPTRSSSDFNFGLIFNREMEVASKTVYRHQRTELDPSVGTLPANLPADPYSGYPDAVAGIGVLADLRVLDEIVGIGFYNYAEIKAVFEKRAEQGGWLGKAIGAITGDPDDLASGPLGVIGLGADLLRGNTTYMVQQPIRVVFSSLFIVEGYVNGLTVNFAKFNYAMVPTVCSIELGMQALYVGVARKQTILTYYDELPPQSSTTTPAEPSTTPGEAGGPALQPGDDFTPSNLKISGPPKLLDGKIGSDYYAVFTASGGESNRDHPYRFARLGTIPPGLTFAENGRLSGTPTVNGMYQFQIQVTDHNGLVAAKGFKVFIAL